MMKTHTHQLSLCLRWLLPRRRVVWGLLLIVFVLISSPFMIYKYVHLMSDANDFFNSGMRKPCVFPKFELNGSSVAKFFWHPDLIKCRPLPDLVYVDFKGILQVNKTAVMRTGFTDVQCYYSPIYTKNDELVNFKSETVYKLPAHMPTEFARVKCKDGNDKTVYENIHWSMNFRNGSNMKHLKEENQDQLSVYIYGMESTSRFIAEKKLPKTLKYIREELGGYVLKGYTQVGDGTFANVLALLTGIVPHTYDLTHTTSELPFIWYNFSDKGYASLYSEDRPDIQTMKGFQKTPTDHYGRPYYLAQEEIRSQVDKLLSLPLAFLQHNNMKTGTSSMCFGEKPIHVRMLQYWRDFMEYYDKKLKFSFIMNVGLTHDFINFAELADNDLYNLFNWMKDSGKLDNAILILSGDHGQRYSEFRNTEIGRVTNFMPFGSIVLPKYFRERYPHLHKTLTTNIDRLTTHFDMFATLRDILNRNFAPREPHSNKLKPPRGISLFQEVPETRSCFEAVVPENLCPCYSAKQLSTENSKMKEIGVFIIDTVNRLLDDSPSQCVKLTLSQIVKAQEIYASFHRPKNYNSGFNIRKFLFKEIVNKTRYLIVVRAEPCGGHFEGMVEVTDDGKFTLMGMINRVNSYGKQSYCTTDRMQRLYCCCL